VLLLSSCAPLVIKGRVILGVFNIYIYIYIPYIFIYIIYILVYIYPIDSKGLVGIPNDSKGCSAARRAA